MKKHSENPANHRYPESEGLPEFRNEVSEYMSRRFGVNLDPEKQVINLIGAKEGIGHASLCLIDEGDVSIVPDPGYPVYSAGCNFAGGEIYKMPLLQSRGLLLPPHTPHSSSTAVPFGVPAQSTHDELSPPQTRQ